MSHRTTGWTIAAVFASSALGAAAPGQAWAQSISIPGGDVERLYEVVGNPANTNKTIVLSPGTYVLTPTGPSGARPRGGSLMLQPGMKLVGSNSYADSDHDGVWDATFDDDPVISGKTVIDGTQVAPNEPVSPTGQLELDCMGLGYVNAPVLSTVVLYRDRTTISRVTILAGQSQFAAGPAHSAYLPSGGYVAEINNSMLDGGYVAWGGAAFHDMGCRMRDAASSFVFRNNISRGSLLGLALVNGLTDQRDKLRGPSLRATVTANHFIGNLMGVHSRNSLGTDGGSIDLRSSGNLFEYNNWGIESTAGTNNAAFSGSIGNQLALDSSRDTFRGNETGVIGVGAWRENPDSTLPPVARNELRVTLSSDHFEGGDAMHAWSLFADARAGTDAGNRASVSVRNSTYGGPAPAFRFIDPVPGDTNKVQIVGSNAAFQLSNGVPPTYQQLLVPLNPFDLTGSASTLRFTPASAGYQVAAGAGAMDPDVGARLDFSGGPPVPFPEDDDTVEITLPFGFVFEGQAYSSVWVNTDGNLTFGAGDPDSGARDVARLVSGPPRVAALLVDLGPNIAGGVYARVAADRLVVTWLDVPTWETGLSDQNTFQIVLHADGAVEIVYAGVGTPNNVVGIAPGGNSEAIPAAVDLSAGAASAPTLYESFVGSIMGP